MKRNLVFVTMSMYLFVTCQAQELLWSEVFKEKQHLFDEHSEFSIIKDQQVAYVHDQAPGIAHYEVKSIVIVENGENLVDMRALNHARISMMPDPSKPFESDACNSGLSTASKVRQSLYTSLIAMLEHLDALAPEFGFKSGEISIKIFEGLRDLETQSTLFLNKKAEIMAAHPEMTEEQADTETAKWVSPVKNNVPVHSTGAAVDIRLWNETTQQFLDLGKFGVIWGANTSAPTFSESSSSMQKRNRLYLLMAASKAGLTNYVYEFWHFSCKDRYASYWQEKNPDNRVALYGSID